MRHLALACCLALALPALLHAAESPVTTAAKRTAAAKSTTFESTVTTTIPGQGKFTMTGSGAQKGTSVRLSTRTRAQGASIRLDAVLLKEGGKFVMYMRSPALQAQLPPGKIWVRVDLSTQAASLGVDLGSLLGTSNAFAPLEKGLVSTTRVGREVVAGRTTTRYRAVVDLKRAARADRAYGEQIASLERATGVRFGRATYHVWVGEGRIRRVRFSMPTAVAGSRGTAVQTITFRSFDTPVSIAPPPRAQVFSP